MSMWQTGYDDGRKSERIKIAPLLEAVTDAIYMLEQIKAGYDLPSTAQARAQYIAMGRELRRIRDTYLAE